MSGVFVYTIRGCPYCAKAKTLLMTKGIAFEEVDVTTDPSTRKWLRETTGKKTVPQTFVKGRPVGGFADLDALDRSGQLRRVMSGR